MELKFHKVTSLPGSLDPNAVYFVQNNTYAESYITSSSGVARSIGNSAMINTLIAAQLSSINTTRVVNDITARNALAPSVVTLAYVINATGDVTVSTGGATYVFNPGTSTWTKIAEFESLDMVLSWANITGKPTFSPANIDLAVTNSHTHTNKTQLDLLSVVNGVLNYNGDEVKNWSTINW